MLIAKLNKAAWPGTVSTMTTVMTPVTDLFIKPDPAMTRRETRAYVLMELERWLTGPVCAEAKQLASLYPSPDEGSGSGSTAALRLFMILGVMERNMYDYDLPMDYNERFAYAARWAFSACEDYLVTGLRGGVKLVDDAVGFVAVELLPCGKTIESFWNYSPFEPLRNAPPLTEAEDVEATETDESIYEDQEEWSSTTGSISDSETVADVQFQVQKGIDAGFDALASRAREFLTSDHQIMIPGWVLAASGSIMVGYLWIWVALISALSSR